MSLILISVKYSSFNCNVISVGSVSSLVVVSSSNSPTAFNFLITEVMLYIDPLKLNDMKMASLKGYDFSGFCGILYIERSRVVHSLYFLT